MIKELFGIALILVEFTFTSRVILENAGKKSHLISLLKLLQFY